MSGPWKLRGYTVERLLGSGASGEVWRAHISATGDPVALKRLVVRDAEQGRRAHAEAAMLSVLDHPNLVRLHTLVPDDDVAVLVLDLADGGSLADLLAARGRLTPGEVITAVAPIAAALAYVHGQGVVHGDVSSANILFTGGGVPLLADLGVARLTGDSSDAESTPAYVDPSVAAGCIPGPASDVFMLGAVALHALTGTPPWPGPTADAALAAARRGDLEDVAARLARAGVAKAMATIIGRALVIDPGRRCTAADLALELRHSGRPIAVELSAGRARREPRAFPEPPLEPPVHGQTSPRQWPRIAPGADARPDPAASPTTSSARRPHIGRHAALPGAVASAPIRRPEDASSDDAAGVVLAVVAGDPAPTNAIRRPRPVIPRPRRRRGRRWVFVPVAALVAAALAAGVAVWWRQSSAGSPQQPVAQGAVHSPASAHPRPAIPTSATPRSATAGWAQTLRELDSLRGKAFATRNAALLREVYVAGPLLAADTKLLLELVPPGCRLVGVRTTYEQVQVLPATNGATLSTQASLSSSSLQCPHRAARPADGVGPAHIRLRLVATASGRRIAAQQVS